MIDHQTLSGKHDSGCVWFGKCIQVCAKVYVCLEGDDDTYMEAAEITLPS